MVASVIFRLGATATASVPVRLYCRSTIAAIKLNVARGKVVAKILFFLNLVLDCRSSR